MATNDSPKMATKLIHAGELRPQVMGAVTLPIFQSSTYLNNDDPDYRYIRLNNTPNHQVVSAKLAALENAEAAQVTASGMAAITTAILSICKAGDHLLVASKLYGGTFNFISQDLPACGIEYTFIDATDPGSWKAHMRPTTRAIYVEAMTNPLLEVTDMSATADFAREHEIVSMVDNTFTSPINFRPADLGLDLSLHSCTKYINGHTDIVAGAAIGRADLIEAFNAKLCRLGGSLDPHACFLLHRGMKTLAVRMKHQSCSAMKLAESLEGDDRVRRVYYPGLASSPFHELASRQFDGFSAMLAFEPTGGVEAAQRFMKQVKLPHVAPSLGGVESLVTRPVQTTHMGLSSEQLDRLGIVPELIRVSVGLEDAEDLVADFAQALG